MMKSSDISIEMLNEDAISINTADIIVKKWKTIELLINFDGKNLKCNLNESLSSLFYLTFLFSMSWYYNTYLFNYSNASLFQNSILFYIFTFYITILLIFANIGSKTDRIYKNLHNEMFFYSYKMYIPHNFLLASLSSGLIYGSSILFLEDSTNSTGIKIT